MLALTTGASTKWPRWTTTDVAIIEKLHYYMVVKDGLKTIQLRVHLPEHASAADTNGNGTPDASATYTIESCRSRNATK